MARLLNKNSEVKKKMQEAKKSQWVLDKANKLKTFAKKNLKRILENVKAL